MGDQITGPHSGFFVDEYPDDPLPKLQAEYATAMADLKRSLAPAAEKDGLDLEQLTQAVMFKHQEPERFEAVRDEAERQAAQVQQMRQAYRDLHSKYEAASDALTANEKYRIKGLLHTLHAKLKQSEGN